MRDNTVTLVTLVAPARMCGVVKAGAYGHGAVPVARAMLDGGASWLAVATVEEAVELRDAGIDAPVLLLSEPPLAALGEVAARGVTPTLYSHAAVEAAAKAVAAAGGGARLAVHVKVDTGMHRVGASADEVVGIALAVTERPELRLEGLWTHFAMADHPDDLFTAEQHGRFTAVVRDLAARGVHPPVLHTANSAGAIAHPATRHDLVRCGIALYGVPPSPALHGHVGLWPAMSLKAGVSQVKEVAAGEGISYGMHYRFGQRSVVATVPLGYADGVPWRLAGAGGEVLIGGRRRPLAGSITMDQITVDCGDDASVAPGDEVVLLGGQADECIDAWEWAGRIGTIAYEVLSGVGPRVPRAYLPG